MKRYIIIFCIIIFQFGAFSTQAKKIEQSVHQVIKTKSDWFSFDEKIFLGIEQSKLLEIHKGLKPLINNLEAKYHKVLVQRKKSVDGLDVIYTFNDNLPTLEIVMLMRQLNENLTDTDILREIVDSYGIPLEYHLEKQRGRRYMSLVWRKKEATLVFSYNLKEKTSSSRNIFLRVSRGNTELTKLFKSTKPDGYLKDIGKAKKIVRSFSKNYSN